MAANDLNSDPLIGRDEFASECASLGFGCGDPCGGGLARGRHGADVQVEVSSARRKLAEPVGAARSSESRLTGGFATSTAVVAPSAQGFTAGGRSAADKQVSAAFLLVQPKST